MMDEDITAKERLKQIDEERKVLKVQVKDEREQRLVKAAEMRAKRDVQIEIIQERVNGILSIIYTYNKLGKVAKVEFDVFNKVLREIHRAPDAPKEDVAADSTNN